MGNTLLTIFRPTWKKIAWTVVLVICFGFLTFLFVAQRHGLEWHDYAIAALSPPTALARWAADKGLLGDYELGSWVAFVTAWALQLLYCYLIVCLLASFLHLLKAIFAKAH